MVMISIMKKIDKMSVSVKIQYLLAIIPYLGILIAWITSLLNISKLDRTVIFKWFIFTMLPTLAVFAIFFVILYYCNLESKDLQTAFNVIFSYIMFVICAFISIAIECAVIKKLGQITKDNHNEADEIK